MSYDVFSLWFDGPRPIPDLGFLATSLIGLALIALVLASIVAARGHLGDNAVWTWRGAAHHGPDA